MDLQQKLREDLKQALRGGDKARIVVLRLVLAGIRNEEIDRGASLDDLGVLGVVAKEVKRHRESVEAFSKGNRQDLASKEEAELEVLLDYLPKQMSRGEITAAARQMIEEVGARAPTDKGKVMSRLMPQLKGKAEGQEVSNIVSELLTSLSSG
jgi:hypothetical protein